MIKNLSERQNLHDINKKIIQNYKIYSSLLKIVLPDENYPRDFFEKVFQTIEVFDKNEKIQKPVEKKNLSKTPLKRKWSKQSKNVDIVNNLSIDSRCDLNYFLILSLFILFK